MVAALSLGEPLRRGLFRRGVPVEGRWIRVGREGRYLLVTARPDKRGELDWEGIRDLAGRAAGRMLLPRGLAPPRWTGIRPFEGCLLGQELMAVTAAVLLRDATQPPRRLPVAIWDPRGRMPQLAFALLPYTSNLQVITGAPRRYEEAQGQAMQRYGASFAVTGDFACARRAALLLAPDGLYGEQPPSRALVLSGVPETGRGVVGGYVPQAPAAWLSACPPGCDPWLFLSAMHEWGGLRGLLSRPPSALWMEGRAVRLQDAVCRLAGLDIGISV